MIYILLIICGVIIGYGLEWFSVFSLQGRDFTRMKYGKHCTAVVFGMFLPLLWYISDSSESFIIGVVLAVLMIIVTLTDMMAMLILNKTLLLFVFPIIILRSIFPLENGLVSSISGALLAFVILAVLAIASKGQVGGGDVKLYTLLGFFFGVNAVLVHLFLACILAIVGTLCLILLKKKQRTDAISFAPYIALASMVIVIIGG